MLKPGDWITQYSAGYWQVVAIYPKYAEEDHTSAEHSWKKGDRLGNWVVAKKAFTPKMKPANACECVDSFWCSKVAPDIQTVIELAFAQNPKAHAKFLAAPVMPRPMVTSIWLNLPQEQKEGFRLILADLPRRFTEEIFWQTADTYRPSVCDPSAASHILYLLSYPWELDEQFDMLYYAAELKLLAQS